MPYLNQAGQPIHEEQLFTCVGSRDEITDQTRNDAIALILQHLGVEIVATNATKHGNTEMVLRKPEP